MPSATILAPTSAKAIAAVEASKTLPAEVKAHVIEGLTGGPDSPVIVDIRFEPQKVGFLTHVFVEEAEHIGVPKDDTQAELGI